MIRVIRDNLVNPFSLIGILFFSVYFNIRFLPFKQAIKLPVIIHWKTKILIRNSKIEIVSDDIKMGMILYGFGFGEDPWPAGNILKLNDSRLVFHGVAQFRAGATLSCEGGGLEIGDGIHAASSVQIICYEKISIGDDVAIAASVSIRDTDGAHELDSVRNRTAPIVIGNHVWIGAKSNILKGVSLKDGAIVGFNSLVTSSINDTHEENSVVAGHVAKQVKHPVSWKL